MENASGKVKTMKVRNPNFFIGIAPSSTTWFNRSVASLPSKCRIHNPKDLHITIAFLGRIESPQIIDSLKSYIDNIPTFPIPQHYNLAEPHAFPSLARMTAIGYKIGFNYDLIKDFIFVHRPKFYEITDPNSVKHDKRIPKPHITIARPPKSDSINSVQDNEYIKRKMIEWVENKQNNHIPIEHALLLHEISLYTWTDTYPQAPLYKKIHSKSLISQEMIHETMLESNGKQHLLSYDGSINDNDNQRDTEIRPFAL